jgi:hypothetical protein
MSLTWQESLLILSWYIAATALLITLPATSQAQSKALAYGPLPRPEVNADSWVLIEIWPEVRDVTLSAYFLHSSYEKNQNLCDAIKRALDRDQDARAQKAHQKFTSYRLCLPVSQARAEGYIEP